MSSESSDIGIYLAGAAVAFSATNIDDFCLLIVYFARVRGKQGIDAFQVCCGQIFGFTIICALSLLGILLGLFISAEYISLIGFVPILMGLKNIWEVYQDMHNSEIASDESHTIANTITTAKIIGEDSIDVENLEGLNSSTIEKFQITNIEANDTTTCEKSTVQEPGNIDADRSDADCNQNMQSPHEEGSEDNGESNCLSRAVGLLFGSVINREILQIAMITVANGGDNISIYLPLFATGSAARILITLAVFYFLLAVWLVTAYYLVQGKKLTELLEKYGSFIVPPLLIGIGIYILSDSILFHGV